AHGDSPLRLVDALARRYRTRRLLLMSCLELLALEFPRCSEAKAAHNERVVVLLFALLVGPVVGPYPGLDEQLVALTGVVRERLAHRTEGDEPQAGRNLAGRTPLVLPRIVIGDEAETGVAGVVLGNELGVASEIAHRGQRETVHGAAPRRSLVGEYRGAA